MMRRVREPKCGIPGCTDEIIGAYRGWIENETTDDGTPAMRPVQFWCKRHEAELIPRLRKPGRRLTQAELERILRP
jgi:hypothetical protein